MSTSSSTTTATDQLQCLLSIPPQTFTGQRNNPHAVAHAALEEIRESGDPQWLFLRTILESSSSSSTTTTSQQGKKEELLFHCISGARYVIMTQWNQYSDQFTSTIRDFFMCMGDHLGGGGGGGGDSLTSPSSKTVTMACYTSSVAFWKRQWAELIQQQQQQQPSIPGSPPSTTNNRAVVVAYPEQERQILEQIGTITRLSNPTELFQYLSGHISTNHTTMQGSCQYISALVGEFSGKSVVPYRLPMEFHKEAYALFETKGALDECLKLAMTVLSQTVTQMASSSSMKPELAQSIVQVTIDIIGWEFGGSEWMHLPSSRVLIRPPEHWREYLMRPDFIGAVFTVHEQCLQQQNHDLAHGLRQLLLLLCSLTGPMFRGKQERELFAQYLCEGSQQLLTLCRMDQHNQSLLFDTYSLVARLISNFRLAVLCNLPTLIPVLDGVRVTATELLRANMAECESVGGDIYNMENQEWRDEALSLVLENVSLLCRDPWLKDPRADETSRGTAHAKLTQTLGPLYEEFVTCRTRMAYFEAHYRKKHAENDPNHDDDDDDKDEIDAAAMEEEMEAVACLGRLHLPSALSCMSLLFQRVLPQLQRAWHENGPVTPDVAAQLEESRLMVIHMGHLLTDFDKQEGKSKLPAAIELSCNVNESLVNEIGSLMQAVLTLMEAQATKLGENPTNPRIGQELGQSFLWFLERWIYTYIFRAANDNATKIRLFWSEQEAARQVIAFAVWLCSKYQSYWPNYRALQDGTARLLLTMGKHGPIVRSIIVQSQTFQQLFVCYCLTIGISKGTTLDQLETSVRTQAGGNAPLLSMEVVRGYHQLPYQDKSQIMTAFLITCGDHDEASLHMFNELLKAVHDAFSSLMQALSTKQVSPANHEIKEMVSYCVELFGGIARATNDIATEGDRIPRFLNPCLPLLSGLMDYYADDLFICEQLLNLFCDYPSNCAGFLDSGQSGVLFHSSASLLKSYSTRHCTARVIHLTSSKEAEKEEEKAYSDILCTINLLMNLGTETSPTKDAVDSEQVAELIFFGLQQIIPLMTQGLLQYPTFCEKYFSLIGFTMQSYSKKVSALPYELLDSLLQSLLFGVNHQDRNVAQHCLEGIGDLAIEQLKSGALSHHLVQRGDLLDGCTRKIFQDVVFQPLVWDRLEATSNALLPLAAVGVARFVIVVNELMESRVSREQQNRLRTSMEKLLAHEVIANVLAEGYEGRINRRNFKESFEEFVKTVHSFLLFR